MTPATATISAAGGSRKFTVTSYKRQYSYSNAGNRIYVEGSQTNVAYTSENSGSGTWTAASDTISYGANTGSTQPSGTITWTQSESFGSDPKKTATATHKQNADSIKPNGNGYSNPRIITSVILQLFRLLEVIRHLVTPTNRLYIGYPEKQQHLHLVEPHHLTEPQEQQL